MIPSQTSHQNENADLSLAPREDPPNEFVRLPGLLRRWELSQVVEPSADYRIEAAGETSDGTPVFAVYHRERTPEADVSVPVTVSFQGGHQPIHARLLPFHSNDPVFGVLVVSPRPDGPGLQSRVREILARTPPPALARPLPEAVPIPASAACTMPTQESLCLPKE
ncbi:MAG TPA: hypothetical protein VFP84_16210 [Kofleriaceae bacterium]|nr:hypothetical protein [Kofleriaceae bacterium]